MTKINPPRTSDADLVKLLKGIETGKVTLTLDRLASAPALEVQNGLYFYDTSNKWTIAVYVDCGEFDYFDHFQHGGTIIRYTNLSRHYPKTVQQSRLYRGELGKKVWGIKNED